MAAQFENLRMVFPNKRFNFHLARLLGCRRNCHNARATALSSKRSQVPASGVFDKSACHFALDKQAALEALNCRVTLSVNYVGLHLVGWLVNAFAVVSKTK